MTGRRVTCTACDRPRASTVTGLVYPHTVPGSRTRCPGAGRLPVEAGAASLASTTALRRLIDDLPVRRLDGVAVVRLADLTAAIDQARAAAGLPPMDPGETDA